MHLIELRRIAEGVGGLLGEVVLGLRRLDLRQGLQHGPPGLGIHRLGQSDDRLGSGGIGGLGRVGGPHQQGNGLGRDLFRLRQLTRHRRQQAGFGGGPRQESVQSVAGGDAMTGELAADERGLGGLRLLEPGLQGGGDAGRAFPGFGLIIRPAGVGPGAPRIALPRSFLEMQAAERGDHAGASGGIRFGGEPLDQGIDHRESMQRLQHPQGGRPCRVGRLRLVDDLEAGLRGRQIGESPHHGVGHDRIRIGQMLRQRGDGGRAGQAGSGVGGRAADHRIAGVEKATDEIGRDQPQRPSGSRQGVEDGRGQSLIGHHAGQTALRFLGEAQHHGVHRGDAGGLGGGFVGDQVAQERQHGIAVHTGRGGLAEQGPLGFQTAAVAGRAERLDELLGRQRLEVGHRRRRVALRSDARDEPDLGPDPGERGALPAGGINGAVAIHIEVGHAGQSHEFLLARGHRGALRCQAVVVDPIASPVGGERRVVPAGRKPRFIDPGRTTSRAPTVVGQGLDDLVAEVLEEARIAVLRSPAEVVEPDVPAATVVGVVAGEAFEFRAQGDLQDIARAVGPSFQTTAVGPEPHHAAPAHLQSGAVGTHGFHEAEVADGRIQPAIDTERQAIGSVVGRPILEGPSDAADERLLLVGHAIAVLVDEHAHVRGVEQVQTVVVPDEAARRVDVGHEGLHLVALTVAVGVAYAQHSAQVRLAVERPVAVTGDIERAIRRGRHEHRVIHRWRRGEDRHLELRRGADVLHQPLDLARGHRGQSGQFFRRRLPILGGEGLGPQRRQGQTESGPQTEARTRRDHGGHP